ncbi:uncharacterized protein LOC131641686 [Vicia villosa]|uniref:uncharacterized protein LOC131641686 n=1 Tax=Vicia villosa TaxID=3911 RepID=UPI00273C265E|nr:uncharacterized protein LOC131641686 [Vicia villosa]
MAQAMQNQPNADENAGSRSLATFQRENPPVFKEIKKAVSYQKIRIFVDLVDSCRIYEEDNNAHYRVINEKRGKNQQSREKPYDAGKGKQRITHGHKTSGGDAPARIICFKCGRPGHKSNACTVDVKRCYRCGKTGHMSSDCKHKDVVCFNCGAEGHFDSQCQKPKKTAVGGKVFALSGTQTSSEDGLVREMVVELPAKGTVTTSLMCLDCPLSIFDRDFVVDFVCLPLVGLDVVLGMNWLKRNYVHINCFNNKVRFSSLKEEGVGLLTGKQLKQLMQDEAQMFSLMASLSFENQVRIDDLKVVREFYEVFPNDIPDVPPEREVEFTIDLVPVSFLGHVISGNQMFKVQAIGTQQNNM